MEEREREREREDSRTAVAVKRQAQAVARARPPRVGGLHARTRLCFVLPTLLPWPLASRRLAVTVWSAAVALPSILPFIPSTHPFIHDLSTIYRTTTFSFAFALVLLRTFVCRVCTITTSIHLYIFYLPHFSTHFYCISIFFSYCRLQKKKTTTNKQTNKQTNNNLMLLLLLLLLSLQLLLQQHLLCYFNIRT